MNVRQAVVAFHHPSKILAMILRVFYKYSNSLISIAYKIKRNRVMVVRRIYSHLPIFIKSKLQSVRVVNAIKYSDRSNARYYFKSGISNVDFFSVLNQRKVEYVLLRWWENFPNVDEGEDLDILISDSDREKISDLIVRYPSGQKCDIYTVTGVASGGYKGLPYFTYALAADVLAERRLYLGQVYVPSERMYFYTLIYHLLFHKTKMLHEGRFYDHDYLSQVFELNRAGICENNCDANAIFNALKNAGYLPSDDLMSKLIHVEPELSRYYEPLSCTTERGELLVFVVRERAYKGGFVDKICRELKGRGLDVLRCSVLNSQEVEYISRHFRGGRWDSGPYAKSGGDPAVIISCHDYYPSAMPDRLQNKYQTMTNINIYSAKKSCRHNILRHKFLTSYYNPMHSADNEREAFHYLECLGESGAKVIRDSYLRRQEFYTSYPVVEVLSEGRRSKVEKIIFDGELAIKKTFRNDCERFFLRELFAAEVMSARYEFIPKLKARGENYIILPFIESADEKSVDLSEYGQQVRLVINGFYQEGYEYINFTPENIIVDKGGVFYAIDYEFVQPISKKVKHISRTVMVSGVSKGYEGDLPANYFGYNSSFNYIWSDIVGKW